MTQDKSQFLTHLSHRASSVLMDSDAPFANWQVCLQYHCDYVNVCVCMCGCACLCYLCLDASMLVNLFLAFLPVTLKCAIMWVVKNI